MEIPADYLLAKNELSTRLLPHFARGKPVWRALSVSDALRQAGSNVHGIGIGYKRVEDNLTATLSIRLHVVQKLAESLLPPRHRLPKEIDGIPVDVIESDTMQFAQAGPQICTDKRKTQQRPAIGGISASLHSVRDGTLGYFCRSISPGDDPQAIYALGNNHVFANVNAAQPGEPICQPSPADGGAAANNLAVFSRCVELSTDGQVNRVDAAIAKLLPGIDFKPEICSIGAVNGTAPASIAEIVMHGRTSGPMNGFVEELFHDDRITLIRGTELLVVHMANQLWISGKGGARLADLGDSGSLVLDANTHAAVGLFCAISADGRFGMANHIDDVLSELKIQLV